MQRVIGGVIVSYGLAVVAVALMLGVRWWVLPGPGTTGTATLFMPAVVAAAWVGGLGPGLLATAVAVLGIACFFSEPIGSLAVHDRQEAMRLVVFAVAGTLVSLLAGAAHRSRRRAAATERRLRESQDRYRAFLANSSEAIWRFELDEPIPTNLPPDEQIDRMYRHGYLAECNDAMARMYGAAGAEQLVGKRLGEFHVRERPENVQFMRAFVAAGYRLADVESVERDVDGRTRYFSNSLTGQVEDGRLVRAWGTQRDVTALHQAAAALRASEEQFRLVTDAIPSLVSYVDASHRYRFNNRAYEEWFGVSREWVRGRHMRDVLGEVAYDRVRPHVERALAGELVQYEAEVPYRTGRTRHIEATYVPHLDPDGRVEGIVVLVNDVTSRRRRLEHERLLAEATAVLASSLDYDATLRQVAALAVPTLGDWCAVDMRDGDDGRVRRLAAKHADAAQERLAAELWQKYPPRPDDPAGLMAVLRTGEPRMYPEITDEMLAAAARDAEHLRMVRELGPRSAIIVPLVARGRTLGAITIATTGPGRAYGHRELGFATDLARRAALAVDNARLYREAQHANRLKDEFLATVSHELRTPLNAILGWAQLLRIDGDTDDFDHGLETIERNAKAQAELIEDLLDISRIITGKLRLSVREVDLVPVLDAAIESVRPAADAKGIVLRATFDPRAPSVSGDPNRLQQVAWNLLSNAIKFTPRGGHVALRLQHVDAARGPGARGNNDDDGGGGHGGGGDGHVEISVTDTGSGIDPAFLPHLFQRFRQADASTTREHGGLGLGLSIVRHLVELHGGTVAVDSPGVGQGATFTVRLPAPSRAAGAARPAPATGGAAAASSEAPAAAAAGHAADPRARLAGIKVLVVDDDPDARDLLARILRTSRADVTTAASAADALAAIERDRPDVLLSDIGMPGEDGYALIRQLRQREQEQSARGGGNGATHLPAVALTAFARPEDRRAALSAGFQMHVPKPVEPAELTTVVAGLVGR